MPKGQALELEVFKNYSEVEVKKVSETAHTVVLTPGTNKRFRLLGMWIASSGETLLTMEDGTTAFLTILLAAKTMVQVNLATLPASGYLSSEVGNKLQLKVGETSVKITGFIYGIEDVA